jgi:hypothetical protein
MAAIIGLLFRIHRKQSTTGATKMKSSIFSILFLTILFAGTYNYALSCGNSEKLCCCIHGSEKSNSPNHILTGKITSATLTAALDKEIMTVNSDTNCGICICNQDNSEPGNQSTTTSLQIGKYHLTRPILYIPETSDIKKRSQSSIKIQQNSPPAHIPLRI